MLQACTAVWWTEPSRTCTMWMWSTKLKWVQVRSHVCCLHSLLPFPALISVSDTTSLPVVPKLKPLQPPPATGFSHKHYVSTVSCHLQVTEHPMKGHRSRKAVQDLLPQPGSVHTLVQLEHVQSWVASAASGGAKAYALSRY